MIESQDDFEQRLILFEREKGILESELLQQYDHGESLDQEIMANSSCPRCC